MFVSQFVKLLSFLIRKGVVIGRTGLQVPALFFAVKPYISLLTAHNEHLREGGKTGPIKSLYKHRF